jgi:hypothetical protein
VSDQQQQLEGFAMNPIHQEDGQWYHWDETWANRLGPFPDYETAKKSLDDYCKWLDEQKK